MPKHRTRWLALVLVMSMVATLLLPAAAMAATDSDSKPPEPPFWDVFLTPYHEAVGALHAIGVVGGTGPGTYSPNDPVTRGQMAAFLIRALGKTNLVPQGNPFDDVPANHFARNSIGVAAEMGLIQGVGNRQFAPEAPVTYEQAATMLIRALGYEKTVVEPYPIGHTLKAKALGLVDNTKYVIGQPANRGDVAIMLHAAVFKVANPVSGLTLSQSVHKKAVSLEVTPGAGAVTTGSVKLKAFGKDWYGKEIDLPIQWKVLAGDAVIDPDGTLTVTGNKAITVQATSGGLVRTVAYQIIQSMTASASAVSVKQGQTVTLSASGTMSDGTKVAVQPAWRVVSGPATVDASGKLTVTGSGAITVEAQLGQLTSQVQLASSAQITISPTYQVIAKGQQAKFTATVTDDKGKPVNAPVTWSVVTGDGTVDENGVFTAGSRNATIEAAIGDVKTTASVQVISRLEVTPKNLSLGKSETQQFSVMGYTNEGKSVAVEATWATEGGSIGIINEEGKFIATGPATGKVVATYAGLRGESSVSVAGEAVAIQVTIDRTNLVANGTSTATVTATLVDALGNKTRGDIDTIHFTLNNPLMGTLSSTSAPVVDGQATVTLTTKPQVGTGLITASATGGVRAGTLLVSTNLPYLSRVKLEAYPNPLSADGVSESEIFAVLLDQDGQPYKNVSGAPYPVTLSANNTAAGNLTSQLIYVSSGYDRASVRFRASTAVGSTVVSGTALAAVEPVTVSTTTVGPAAKLFIRRDLTPVKADGQEEMVIKIEIRDANGNVRTADNGVQVYIAATNGDYNVTLGASATVNGIGTIRFKTTRAGMYTLKAYSNNSALQTDETTGTFKPGDPYKLLLSVEPSGTIAADTVSVVDLTAKVVDMNNNLVDNATHQVTFAKLSDNNVVTVPNTLTVNAQGGIARLELKATAWTGSETFKATAPGLLESPTVSVTSQIVGAPAKVKVVSTTNAPVGGKATVKVHVLDSRDRLVTSANDLYVTLTGTSSSAVFNSPQKVKAGVATFEVTNNKAETIKLTASSGALTPDANNHAVVFTAGIADRIVLKANPASLAADGVSRTTITADLVDAFGNSLGQSQLVNLTSSNTGVAHLSSGYLSTGGGSVSLIATTTPGTVTVSGTNASGYRVEPLTINTYVVGAPVTAIVDTPSTAPAGTGANSQIQIRVRIVDANGNQVTSLNTGANLTAVGLSITGNAGNTTSISSTNSTGLSTYGVLPNGITVGSAGVQSGAATFIFTNTRAETVTITPHVYYNGVRLTPQTATATTTAAAATQLLLTPGSTTLSTEYLDRTTLRVTLADVYGNAVSGSSDTVTLRLSSTDHLTVDQTTVTVTNGTADVVVKSQVKLYGGSTTITATSANTGLTATTVIATDLPPARPQTLYAADQGGDSQIITSGDVAVKVSFRIQPRNSAQRVFVYVNGVVVPVYSDTSFSTVVENVGPGSVVFVGYIKPSDLGGWGQKEIRATLSSGLGMSPMSDASTVTYTP